jgi:phospholipase A1/A2
MKILKTSAVFRATLACVLFLLLSAFSCHAAAIQDDLTKCAAIKDDNAARLKCFDELANKPIPAKNTVIEKPADKMATKESSTVNISEKTAAKESAREETLSLMEKHWDMRTTSDVERNIFVLYPYRPCFLLAAAYNSSLNEASQLDIDPNAKAQYNEVKFQLSFKFKIWEDLFKGTFKDTIEKKTGIRGIDVWIAYTQLSFWQLYNSAFSAPFRDTNYEPELLFNFRLQHEIPHLMGTKLQFVNVGFNHQSNGRSEPLSRSWNRIVANVGLEKTLDAEKKDSFNILLKTWWRLPENDEDDDNPTLSEYVGYGELWGTLYWKKQRFALMLRNNLRAENKGAVQVDWSFPLPLIGDKVSGYLQYFNGYGEGLLDYNSSSNRISAGFMLTDWK